MAHPSILYRPDSIVHFSNDIQDWKIDGTNIPVYQSTPNVGNAFYQGPFLADQAVTITATRMSSNMVNLTITSVFDPALNSTSSIEVMTTAGGVVQYALPVAFRPLTAKTIIIRLNNNAAYYGFIIIGTDGTISLVSNTSTTFGIGTMFAGNVDVTYHI